MKVSEEEFALLKESARRVGMRLAAWVREALLAARAESVSHSEPDSNEVSLAELLAQRSLLLNLQFRTHHAGTEAAPASCGSVTAHSAANGAASRPASLFRCRQGWRPRSTPSAAGLGRSQQRLDCGSDRRAQAGAWIPARSSGECAVIALSDLVEGLRFGQCIERGI
jgi:hypothetical protein